MAEPGAYLVIRSGAPDVRFRTFRDAIAPGHVIIAEARIHEVEALEPGTVPAHTLVLGFPDGLTARAAWEAMPSDLLAEPYPPLVLLTGAVPPDGFADPAIPTKANVASAAEDGPVLLLIEGTGRDDDRMNAYRGVLLPLMFDLAAYYTVFELGGDVAVLSGRWDEAIFAISRWPSRAAAHQFWLCDRYQQTAIPLRLNFGDFQVALVPEASDG